MASKFKVLYRQKDDELTELITEINRMYLERIRKVEELDDPLELKVKLLQLWVNDLLEQNRSLVETVQDLEEAAAEWMLRLEEQFKTTSSPTQDGISKIQDSDGHTSVSLRALAKRLEVDVRSLLELIRRVRIEGSWDVKGLVFHHVSYDDIFGTDPPPPLQRRVEAPTLLAKTSPDLQKLKTEADFWKSRVEACEAEARSRQPESDITHRLLATKVYPSWKSPDAELVWSQHIQLDELLGSVVDLERSITAAAEDLKKLASKELQQMVSKKRQLVPDIRTAADHLQQLAQAVTKELKSVEEQHPSHLSGTCMFDSEKMISFQKDKVNNLANYFLYVHKEVKDLEKKFELPDKKLQAEDGVIEEVVSSFILTVCHLLELANKVNKVMEEIAEQILHHQDIREKNVMNAVKAMQLHGLRQDRDDVLQVPFICNSPESLESYVELYEKKIRVQDNIIVRLQVIEDRIKKQCEDVVGCSHSYVKLMMHDQLCKRDSTLNTLNQQLYLVKNRILQLEESICALSAKSKGKNAATQSTCLQCDGCKIMMAETAGTPILLTSLLSCKLDASRKQARIQQEKINVLKQSISEVSQHLKDLRSGVGKDCRMWPDPEIKVLQPVRCWSKETCESTRSAPSLLLHTCDAALKREHLANFTEGAHCETLNSEIAALIPRLRGRTVDLSTIQAQLEDASGCICHEVEVPDKAIADLANKVTKISRQLAKTEDQMKVHEDIIVQLRSLCQDYEVAVRGLENKIKELVQNLPVNEVEIARQFETAKTQMKTHEEIICQLKGLCMDYECTVRHLENTIKGMGTNINSEVAELKRQLDVAYSKLQSAHKEIANQEEIIAFMTDSANVHNSKIKELECKIKAYEKEVMQNEDIISNCTTAGVTKVREEAVTQFHDNYEKMVETKLAELQAQADNLSRENTVLQEQLCTSTALVAQLENSVQEWTKCTEELKAVNARQEVFLSDLAMEKQNLSKQLDDCKSQVDCYNSELCSVTAERDQLRQQLTSEKETSCTVAQFQVDSIHVCSADEAATTEKLASMTCKIASLESEVMHLCQTVTDQDNQLKAAKDVANKEVQFQREVCNLNTELENARKLLCGRENTMCELKEKIICLETETQCWRQKVSAQENELNELKCATTRATELELEVRSLQNKLAEANETIARLNTSLQVITPKQDGLRGKACKLCQSTVGMMSPGSEGLSRPVKKQGSIEQDPHKLWMSGVELRRRMTHFTDSKATCIHGVSGFGQTITSGARLREPTGLRRFLSHCTRQPPCSDDILKKLLDAKDNVLVTAEEEINCLKSQVTALKTELQTYRSLNIDYQQLKVDADAQVVLQELKVQLQTWAQQNADLQVEVQTLRRNNERLALDLRLAQKALKDTTSSASSSDRRHSKELQELTKVNLQQNAVIKHLKVREDKLQAEVNALEAARVAVVERNAMLENFNTRLMKELDNVKACLEEHMYQIDQSEERRSVLADEVRNCQQLVSLLLKNVQGCNCTTGSCLVHTQKAELMQQMQKFQEQQQRLVGGVGQLNSKLQTLQQKKHTVSKQDSLCSIIEIQLADLESTAALNTSLQQILFVTDTGLPRTVDRVEPKDQDKCPAGIEKQVSKNVSKEQVAAWRKEKELLLAEVARLKKLQEDTAMEVKTLKAAYHKLKEECDGLRWVGSAEQMQNLTTKVQALQEERQVLRQKLLESQHVKQRLCRELQVLLPTKDRDSDRDRDYIYLMSDESSSQQEWDR